MTESLLFIYIVKGLCGVGVEVEPFYKQIYFFSYVGGLIEVIIYGMVLMRAYNQNAFEFNLARDFLQKDGTYYF
jgi:hypothetical protein